MTAAMAHMWEMGGFMLLALPLWIVGRTLWQLRRQQSPRWWRELLLALFVMFYIGAQFQNIWVFLIYIVLVVAGQGLRLMHLPKDIKAHLTDTGRRKR